MLAGCCFVVFFTESPLCWPFESKLESLHFFNLPCVFLFPTETVSSDRVFPLDKSTSTDRCTGTSGASQVF